ncbi:Glucanosyltransferase-domain-containing protein [Syncephalis pseudoplumigaleata]|uniref:1,3-beta-glucanosyltransferase n=1 Tax=Syncephalis pseudoplumigaleata TaxID=1712513 RepID=A0A4P9Z3P7_9FUNG|nr:Glucanosyltransferase-domain-containing protein [Syncephalis pseudoplumigaleata]|eukprot:RKP26150.1 Glucanosyltransferase-domain-containing protein [Syncephalis pseudoplumigaleata]
MSLLRHALFMGRPSSLPRPPALLGIAVRLVLLIGSLILAVAGGVDALNPIVIKGHKLFDGVTGEEFFVKGVAYQPRGTTKFVDPLANEAGCQRDVPLLKEMNVNTIRVYQVDNDANHDACMKLLSSAGIYLLLDLPTATRSINRLEPAYDHTLLGHYKKTADAFLQYDNMLGFIAGNEVTNEVKTTSASAFVKAALRDIKHYIRQRGAGGRTLPVGYASNDDPSIRMELLNYFNCGEPGERADFYGVNLYEWCGTKATFETSGYKDRHDEFLQYSIPIILTEFGCNLSMPRTFGEVEAIFGPQMTDVLSGGIAYEFSNEENNYGLVQIVNEKQVAKMQDFHNLKTAYAAVRPVGVKMKSLKESRPASQCPATTAGWHSSHRLPPTPSKEACRCMVDTLTCQANAGQLGVAPEEIDQAAGAALTTLCGQIDCRDIGTEAMSGKYGKYSGCSVVERLSWAYNAAYTSGKQSGATCNYGGTAQLSAPKQKEASCQDVLRSAQVHS